VLVLIEQKRKKFRAERKKAGRDVLLRAASHPNRWVRLSAATNLLPLRVDLASQVLEDLASGPQSHVEFDAKMVLREWRAGRLNVS